MRKLHTLILLSLTLAAHAQDTLKIMQYNLLNYGNYTTYCTSENNNHENKDDLIRTIIGYELPDIFTVNEISNFAFYHDRILNSVLNADDRNWYSKGTVSNIAGSNIVNMLYYNSDKLALKSHEVVQSYIRDIDLFTLFCKTPDLTNGDTVFLNCIVAHLKSSSGTTNELARSVMTENVMDWLKQNKEEGNYLIMGDFNTYTSAEPCYQNLINPLPVNQAFRFFDPVNKPGDWGNSGAFASVHTQSVTTVSNGCQASGGMDDRFDHIMATAQIINGSMGLKYIADSYHAVGQDGLHFDKSITDSPVNTTIPAEVLDALYNNSDHLPVRLNLVLTAGGPGGIAEQFLFRNAGIYLQSPELARLFVTSATETPATVSVISITGQLVKSEKIKLVKGRNEINVDISNLKRGVYLVRLTDLQMRMATVKLIK